MPFLATLGKKPFENFVGKGANAGNQSFFLNLFPNKPWFLRVCGTSLLKTPWEKEKLLVTSNFSFSHSVFYLFEELKIKLKMPSANSFNWDESKICRLGRGQ